MLRNAHENAFIAAFDGTLKCIIILSGVGLYTTPDGDYHMHSMWTHLPRGKEINLHELFLCRYKVDQKQIILMHFTI